MQINKVLSDCLNIKAGVPQGSLLGPILFLIYINDIYASIPDASVYLYADDLTLVFCDDDKNSLINKVNENLNAIVQYCELNSLFINIEKTKAMFVFNNAHEYSCQIKKSKQFQKLNF